MKELREIIGLWENHRGQASALATLVRVIGSSYRRPGARMLITTTGDTAGALSAGCIEEEVAMHAREVMASGHPKLIAFDTRRRFGCSGSIEIFVERLYDDLMIELRDRIRARQSCEVVTRFAGPAPLGTRIGCGPLAKDVFVQRIEPELRLIIIGDGADADALVQQAQLLGWEVKVLSSVAQFDIPADPRTAAVIATHHFGRDCAALRYLLPLGLPYVGLLGPRRRREQLLVDVIDSGATIKSQLFAPAGLHLAADTSEEIALSVIAEIQGVFAGGTAEFLRDRKEPIHSTSSAPCTVSAR